jgi:oligosaccharide 4-alpha-D-glucosyltransferase
MMILPAAWFRRIALLAVALASASAHADFGTYRSHRLEGDKAIVVTSQGELHIAAVDDAAFEIHYVETGVRQLPSFALAPVPDVANRDMTVTATESALTISISGLAAEVSKDPVRIAFLRGGSALFEEEHGYFAHDTIRGFRFTLDPEEKILGGGSRVVGMDRRGQRLPLYNRASYGYETDALQMYYSVPAVVSSDRYMIVFDNSARGWLDAGATEPDVLSFEAVGGRTAYLAIAGDSYPELIENYTDVTGRQPMPPRWAFGNYASRFGYRSERETRDVVRRFRRAGIPLDAVILDIFWFGPDIQGHMGNMDWDRNAWPDAEDMIADFRRDGIRTITITEPFILSTSSRWQDAVDNDALARTPTGEPRRFDFYFGNTGLVDVFDDNAQNWFWRPYQALFEQGIGGTWGDLGEPEVHPGNALHLVSETGQVATGDEVHNAYGHLWASMIYERQVETYPDVRPVILMRSGFAGSQRYGMIPWTGDVNRSWGGLKPQVELGLSMSLLGLGYTHSDLGGFAGGETFDSELYLRWLLYGVFQPVYRPHAQDHIAPEPVFHDAETLSLAREFIRLRYRLLPYLYTLAFENSMTGMPLMRPVFFEDESRPELIERADSYLWGDAFFIHPVTDPGLKSVEIDLPDGAWFDFWTGARHTGGKSTIPVTLETIPVLVRAGAFIPMVEPVMSTDDYSSAALTLHYYADQSATRSAGRMYEDDGESRTSIDDGAYELLEWVADRSGNTMTMDFSRSGGTYTGQPATRDLTVEIHNWKHPVASIEIDGVEIGLSRRLPKRGPGAAIDEDTLTVRFRWDHSDSTLRINGVQP